MKINKEKNEHILILTKPPPFQIILNLQKILLNSLQQGLYMTTLLYHQQRAYDGPIRGSRRGVSRDPSRT